MDFIALGLRLLSAAGRFLFVVYLARATSPELVGSYGLVSTLNLLFTQLAGLEIYQIMGRRLHAKDWALVKTDLADQFLIITISHTILILIGGLIFFKEFDHLLPYVAFILIAEHITTEFFRLLIYLLKPRLASALLALKNISWMIIYVCLTEFMDFTHSKELIIEVWAGSLLLIMAPVALKYGIGLYANRSRSRQEITKNSILLVKEAIPFMISSFAISMTSSLDRLIIESSFSKSDFGVYFFYATYASIITLIASFSIGSTLGPKCIKSYSSGDMEEYTRLKKKLNISYIFVVSTISIFLLSTAKPILTIFGGSQYTKDINALYLIILSQALFVLYEPMKMDLYLQKKDYELTLSNLFHLFVFTILVFATAATGRLTFVAGGICFAAIGGYVFFMLHGAQRLIALKDIRK